MPDFKTQRTYEKTHFDMVGQAHTYILKKEGSISKTIAKRLFNYGKRRFKDAGIDVSEMKCTIELNDTSTYYSVYFTNKQGSIFSVNGILWNKSERKIVVDHGVSLEV